MALERRVIDGWDVDGRHVVLHKDKMTFYVPAIDAGSVVARILTDDDAERKDREALPV